MENSTHSFKSSTVEEIDAMESNANYYNIPVLKKGLNLPRSDAEWVNANNYFKFLLELNVPRSEL